MYPSIRTSRWPRRWPLWIAAGLILRLVFIWFPRPGDDDTLDYLQLGHNLFHYGVYGLGSGPGITPTLFRLPAYPIILATFEALFARLWPNSWLNAVCLAQAIADLAAGLLLADLVRRHLSPRAAEIALALAMLCPFTAVETGIGMTESFSIFAVALGIYAADRALAAETADVRDLPALLLAGLASALAMQLRPDSVLLFVSLAAGLFFYIFRARDAEKTRREITRRALAAISIVSFAALLPLLPWTIRNYAEFHVFQPLAPRYLNDPGERANVGFYRWLRTWSVEYVTTATVFWNVGSDDIDLADIPPRAYDSSQQRAQTIALIAEYNRTHAILADLDNRFNALAAERIHTHPFRYYVTLPLERIADMFFRPRTEAFYLDVFWWQWNEHPAESAWAVLLSLVNLFYVAAAAWAFLRGSVPWPWMLGGYLILRCILLGTMENPEPRYSLECFPIFIVAAATALASTRSSATSPAPLTRSHVRQSD